MLKLLPRCSSLLLYSFNPNFNTEWKSFKHFKHIQIWAPTYSNKGNMAKCQGKKSLGLLHANADLNHHTGEAYYL